MNHERFQPLDRLAFLDDVAIRDFYPIFPRPVSIKILFLCEGLAFDSPNGFSFKLVIDALRDNSAVKYANFAVTLASWANNPASVLQKDSTPATYQATYSNYRFSSVDPDTGSLILDMFDEVWMFGISPNTFSPVSASSILSSPVCPTQADLIALTRWMNNGGGVLAMGDHASLGAHLCARIPRVWTMRRWTQEDGAPPINGSSRVDTNQPMRNSQNPAHMNPPEQIPFEAQSDDVPQKIQLRHYPANGRFFRGWRPHPILCGGSLGVIDVLPDHPHEGWVNEDADIDLTADILINSPPADLNAKEYPTIGGIQPRPEVIAWGNTLEDPPYNQQKGDTTAKHFGVIGAYDGQIASLGRVVVDSTWHHWMSINLSGQYEPGVDDDPLTPGTQPLVGLMEANNDAYKKILAYYRNVAVWLAPKAKQQRMLAYVIFWASFSIHTLEDWRIDTPIRVLGGEGLDVLGRSTSSCFVFRWVYELLPEIFLQRRPPFPFEKIDPRDPIGPVCLTCPPDDMLESVALGVLMRNMLEFRDELLENPKALKKLCVEDIENKMMSVFDKSRKETHAVISQRIRAELKHLDEALKKTASKTG